MLELLRLIAGIRIVPRILTGLLIAVAWTATWPNESMHPLLQVVVLWPVCMLVLYALHLLTNPRWAYPTAGLLLSVGLAGLALTTGMTGAESLAALAPVHPAWWGAVLVQAAACWAEGEGWAELTGARG